MCCAGWAAGVNLEGCLEPATNMSQQVQVQQPTGRQQAGLSHPGFRCLPGRHTIWCWLVPNRASKPAWSHAGKQPQCVQFMGDCCFLASQP